MTRFGSCFLTITGIVLLACTAVTKAEEEQGGPRVRKREFVYKRIGDVELKLQVYDVTTGDQSRPRAAIVFFFGGGWRTGSVRQFQPQSRHLAQHGMVAITADYRVSSRHHTKALHCVQDGKSAVRWVRAHAKELGIDPGRIAAGGGSAGGHIAAAVAMVPGFESEGDDTTVSCRPDALVLFNPALVLAPVGDLEPFRKDRAASLVRRMGTDPKKLSPYHHIRSGLPPTIIFHGEADTTVPVTTARLFTKAMRKAGNRCELVTYPKQRHGFFNDRGGKNPYYEKTVAEMDRFLTSLGFLPVR